MIINVEVVIYLVVGVIGSGYDYLCDWWNYLNGMKLFKSNNYNVYVY